MVTFAVEKIFISAGLAPEKMRDDAAAGEKLRGLGGENKPIRNAKRKFARSRAAVQGNVLGIELDEDVAILGGNDLEDLIALAVAHHGEIVASVIRLTKQTSTQWEWRQMKMR